MRAAIVTASWIAAFAVACAVGPGQEPGVPEPGPTAALVPSEEIAGNFLVRQRIAFMAGERGGDFEAVVQQYCGELVVAGISPMGMKLFTITQSGLEVKVEAIQAGQWPFDPARILLDVHRTYFYPLADPPLPDGIHERRFGAERLREHWRSGRLIERQLALGGGEVRDEGEKGGWLRISYGEGAPPNGTRDPRWRSPTVRLTDRLHGYELEIETVAYQSLRCEE